MKTTDSDVASGWMPIESWSDLVPASSDPIRITVEHPPARLIVTLRKAGNWERTLNMLRQAERFDCTFEGTLEERLAPLRSAAALRELDHQFAILGCARGDEIHAINRILAQHGGPEGDIIAVEPDALLRFSKPSVGLPFHLTGQHAHYLSMLNVPAAHSFTTGKGVRVAVVDTGALLHGVVDFYDLVGPSGPHPGLPSDDKDGHGTAMASLIRAVAPDAGIFVVRISDHPQTALLDAMAGVSIAVADCRADIVNLSFGFPGFGNGCFICGASSVSRSIAFETLLRSLSQTHAAIYVAAAGNDAPQQTEFEYPGAYGFCIVAGSANSRGDRSRFSQFRAAGSHKWYAMAPGGETDSSGNPIEEAGHGTHGSCFGTSAATAYLSGMLALFRAESRYQAMPRDAFIHDVLANRCVPHPSGNTQEYGHGIVRYS